MTGDDNATMPQYRREYAQRSAMLLDHDLNDQDLRVLGYNVAAPCLSLARNSWGNTGSASFGSVTRLSVT